jgi:hypothetical protein
MWIRSPRKPAIRAGTRTSQASTPSPLASPRRGALASMGLRSHQSRRRLRIPRHQVCVLRLLSIRLSTHGASSTLVYALPLTARRTIYHDCKSKVPFTPAAVPAEHPPLPAHAAADTDEYEAGLTVIGEFDTVESFCRYFNWLKPPSKLERNSNYHLFKSGIKPMWEDEANANGGKWVLTMKNNPQLLDRCWAWLAMALVGEDLDESDEICGAVVSLRSKVDRIQLWTRSKDDVEKINSIGKKMVKLLDVSETDGIGLEFQVIPFPLRCLAHS